MSFIMKTLNATEHRVDYTVDMWQLYGDNDNGDMEGGYGGCDQWHCLDSCTTLNRFLTAIAMQPNQQCYQ